MSNRMRRPPLMLSLLLTLPATAQWTPLNGPHGAAVTCFAHSPTAVLACTYQGVYRSTDGGLHWNITNSGLATAYPLATAVTYHDNTFYLGIVNGTVYSSTDDGLNWTLTYSSGLGSSIDEILGHNGTLLVAESRGLARSSDGGETFEQVTGLLDSINVMSLAASGSDLFAGTGEHGMFRSADEGVTWEPVVLPVPGYDTAFVPCMASNGPNLVAAPWGVICYSTDFGETWQLGGSDLETTEPLCLAYDGTDVICGSRDGIYLSNDLGASFDAVLLEDGTWTEAYLAMDNIHLAGSLSKGIQRSTNAGATYAGSNDDIPAWSLEHLTSDGQFLYAGSRRNGAHRYDPDTQGWTALCDDLAEYDHYGWEIGVIGPNLVFSGASRVWYSDDNGNNWDQVGGIDLGRHLLQEGDSSYFVGIDGWSGLFTTTNNGEDWNAIQLGAFNVESAILADGYFYICRYGPYGVERSPDGLTWEQVLTDGSLVTAMASDGGTIYTGDSAGVVRTTQDHGETWTTLEAVNETNPWVRSMSVCNGMLTMSTKEALYRYVPGTGWESINQGLEGLQVLSQLCDGTGIVVGTDAGGVFRQGFFEGVPEQFSTIDLECFPNPTNGRLSIRASGVHGRIGMEVINAVGEVVLSRTVTIGVEPMTLSLDLPDGCYAVRLSTGDRVALEQVQILR